MGGCFGTLHRYGSDLRTKAEGFLRFTYCLPQSLCIREVGLSVNGGYCVPFRRRRSRFACSAAKFSVAFESRPGSCIGCDVGRPDVGVAVVVGAESIFQPTGGTGSQNNDR